jgi:hypothetical protein
MKNQAVEVFLGHQPEDENERRFLRRLLYDLEQGGLETVVFANLLLGKSLLQVDFVIVRPQRVVHCELKAWRYPVTGRPNGDWEQHLPDGTTRSTKANPCRQVTAGTYALSDDMHEFARRGGAPAPTGKFYRAIESVVCMYPAIPDGSQIKPAPFVKVMGYEDLLARLRSPGTPGPWSLDDWRAFAAHIGLDLLDEQSEAEQRMRALRERLADYTRRFEASARENLPPHIATGVRVDDEAADSFDLLAALGRGECVTVFGESGAGKSHLARHAGIGAARVGHIPVWLEAGAYGGDLDPLLARAFAPYSSEAPRELLAAAAELGCAIAIVVDGLNECPPPLRRALLDQVAAVHLATGAAVVVTSQARPDLPEPLAGRTVELVAPNEDEKAQILRAYGAEAAIPHSAPFATPFELSIAAACAADLERLTTRAELLGAYVRRTTASEQVRSALRDVAALMYEELRWSLALPEVRTLLQRDTGVAPAVVDAVLACDLVDVRQERVSFVHEEFSRFLASEALVVERADPNALALRIAQPRYADLRADVLSLEPDLSGVAYLLAHADDSALLFAAATGKLGPERQRLADAILIDLLDDAVAVTHGDDVSTCPGGFHFVWSTGHAWTAAERTQLNVIGRLLHRGTFIERVADLLDATDKVAAHEIERLRADGEQAPITNVIAALYAFHPDEDDCLPASLIMDAARRHGFSDRGSVPIAPVSHLPGTPDDWQWGTLFLALALIKPNDPGDAQLIARVLRRSWDQVAYHLRLEALARVADAAWQINDAARDEVIGVLQTLQSENLALSSSLVEALAAYDLITPVHSLAEIDELLAAPPGPAIAARARSVVVSQFEDERVLGPYVEAISSLQPTHRASLLTLAAAATPGDDWFADWVVRQLIDEGDLGDLTTQTVLTRFASSPEPEKWSAPQSSISAYLDSARGCAQFSETPPFELPPTGTLRALGIVAELTFWHARAELGAPRDEERVAALWAELAGPLQASTAQAFYYAQMADRFHEDERIHDVLVAENPGVVREVFEWSLVHRSELARVERSSAFGDLGDYIVDVLKMVGNTETAALLRPYADEPALGEAAARAIRAIEVGTPIEVH